MKLKNGAMYVITLVMVGLVIEVFASALLFYRYKYSIYEQDASKLSTVIVFQLACQRFRLCSAGSPDRTTSDPQPMYSADKDLGYSLNPGSFVMTYRKKNRAGGDDLLKTTFTIKQDRTRYVGTPSETVRRNVYVFGDSFVFGEGVNDEQTFTYLLQNTFQNTRFVLYAVGGYSLTQSYINFQKIKDQIRDTDLIILGYAEWYKTRNVAAPSRLREYGEPRPMISDTQIKHARARVEADGRLTVDFVPIFCKFNRSYCDSPDPSLENMNRVAVELINSIAEGTKATVVLLHFDGRKDDPVLKAISMKVKLLSAAEEDFDYKVRDDVMHFDGHPGPYWHFAIFTKVAKYLRSAGY